MEYRRITCYSTHPASDLSNATYGENQRELKTRTRPQETVVMETVRDEVIVVLRFLHVNHQGAIPQSYLLKYQHVTKLEVGCSVPFYWLFRNLRFLPNLQSLRLGHRAFRKLDEEVPPKGLVKPHKNIRILELCCHDSNEYEKLSAVCSQVELKLDLALNLSKFYLPDLRHFTIRVPARLEEIVHDFVRHYRFQEWDKLYYHHRDDDSVVFSNSRRSASLKGRYLDGDNLDLVHAREDRRPFPQKLRQNSRYAQQILHHVSLRFSPSESGQLLDSSRSQSRNKCEGRDRFRRLSGPKNCDTSSSYLRFSRGNASRAGGDSEAEHTAGPRRTRVTGAHDAEGMAASVLRYLTNFYIRLPRPSADSNSHV